MSWPLTSPLESEISIQPAQEPAARAESPTMGPGNPARSMLREVLETFLFTLLIFFLVRGVVQNFRVEGSSMESNLHTGQYIIVNRAEYFHVDLNTIQRLLPGNQDLAPKLAYLFHLPRRGDIVVFEYPRDTSRDFIKRVIGLPGETVEVRQNQVLINGTPLDEPYLSEAARSQMGNMAPLVVPTDALFVMGDNRGNSSDSRSWGPLPLDKIVGRAWVIYWPQQYWGIIPRAQPTLAMP